jgi:hypothetical protein
MSRELPSDVEQAIARRFGGEAAARVHATLAALYADLTLEAARVVRSVLVLGRSDPDQVEHYALAARRDHRDVIWWAEYDGGEVQLRDLSRPLP